MHNQLCIYPAFCWLYMTALLKRRLGGFTGDGLGATQQVCEATFLLGMLVALA